MTLSAILLTVEMTFECPHCGHTLVKTGNWFQTIGRFQCKGCQDAVRLSYKDKLALFAPDATSGSPRELYAGNEKPRLPIAKGRGPIGTPIWQRTGEGSCAAELKLLAPSY